MKTVFAAVGAIAAAILLVFVLNMAGFLNFQFFAPKVEQVRYDTFKQSQAFNEGTLRELYAYKVQYASANPGQRLALRGAILHMFSTYPRERLPADLQQFRSEIEVGGTSQ